MKKLIAMMLAGAMLFAATGCSSDNSGSTGSGEGGSSDNSGNTDTGGSDGTGNPLPPEGSNAAA